MRAPVYLKPSLAFGLVYGLAMAVSTAANFDPITLQTHALILSLCLIALAIDYVMSWWPAPEKKVAAAQVQYVPGLIWSLVLLIFIGFLFILKIRLNQLGSYDSVQSLRMALIVGDLPSLPFPLSNVQSASHALGVALLVLAVRRSEVKLPWGLRLAIAASLLMSIAIAMLEGNRASFIIIAVQIFLILGLSGRVPSYWKVLGALVLLMASFALLQFYVRQNADGDDASLVMDLVLRNVASYISGGIVAFDKSFSGAAAVPPYVLPVGGSLATLLGGGGASEDVILPFLDLGNDTTGNVYSALFYIGFLYSPFIGYIAFIALAFIASYYFRTCGRSDFSLLMASYMGVTFVLWPLSEYWLSLLPLMFREMLLVFVLGRLAFRRRAESPGGGGLSRRTMPRQIRADVHTT